MQNMVTYWMPKEGTALSEWEDGAAYSRQSGWFAVADGASTGSNSREWAFTLTNAFITAKDDKVFDDTTTGFVDWVVRTRKSFDPQADSFLPSKAPKWVQVAGSQRGSYATLLAGRIADGKVRAVAVGDCCLFRLSPSGTVRSFPLNSPTDFGSSPQLIRSKQSDDATLTSAVRRYEQELDPGDVVFVASDALAEWLTRQIRNRPVWQMLAKIGHGGFQDLCQDLRADHQMKNDDITLFRAITSPENSEN